MIERRQEIEALGAGVLLIAYDHPGLLAAKMMRGLEVPYVLALDPDRKTYGEWGMGRTGLAKSMLSPRLNWRYLKLLFRGEPFLGTAPDMLQLGGDFVLDRDHRVAFAHRMRDSGDRIEVSTLLRRLAGVGDSAPTG